MESVRRENIQTGMLRPGSRMGKLQVVSQVASGGRSELFLARATEAGGDTQTVMLKQLRSRASSERAFETFVEEARIATLLAHPNVVRPQDVGEYEGHYFFTMEYVDGADVRTLVERAGGMPVEVALSIISQAARALHDVHEKCGPDGRSMEIVHRNLSPDNLLVSREGEVKLIDFGHEQETRDKVLRGELAYLAPEQCLLDAVDRRADVFALGILLWELTTGARLFAGQSERELRQQVCVNPIARPSSLRPDYPRALEEIVMRALERKPGARYSTTMELADALDDFSRSSGLVARRRELASYVQDVLARPAAPRVELARSSQQLAAVAGASSQRVQTRPAVRPNAPAAQVAPSKDTGSRRLIGIAVAALLLASASFAVASYVLPSLRQQEARSGAEGGEATSPEQSPTEGASGAAAPSPDGDQDSAGGPIAVDDVLAKPAKGETRAPRRAVIAKEPEPEPAAPVETGAEDEAPKSSIANFESEVKKRRSPKPRPKSKLANFESEVEKRRAPKREKKEEAPPKPKPSAASALLPSQQ